MYYFQYLLILIFNLLFYFFDFTPSKFVFQSISIKYFIKNRRKKNVFIFATIKKFLT